MDTTSNSQSYQSKHYTNAFDLPKRRIQGLWNKERLGLCMIIGSLVVIAAIIGTLLFYQSWTTEQESRRNGQSLAPLIAELPFDHMQPSHADNIFRMIFDSQSRFSLAYISLIDTDGTSLHQVTAPSVNVPTTRVYGDPSNWVGEHQVILSSHDKVQEYYAPWLIDGKLMGHIKLGYFNAKLNFGIHEISFLAVISLLVFILTPLFYQLILREIRQLQQVFNDFENNYSNANNKFASVSELIHDFSHYSQGLIKHSAKLEEECATQITSSSVSAYQYEKFKSILHTCPDGLLVLDESGVITFANNKIASIFGTTAKTIINEPIENWCNEPSLKNYISNLTTNSYVSKTSAEFMLGSGDDKKILCSSMFPIYLSDKQNETIGSLLLLKDNTQQSMAESNQEEFIAHICHELKTPLNTLSMYSEELINQQDTSDEFHLEAVNVIYDETHRMTDLINNLLNISKIETGSMPLNLQRVKLHEFLVDIFDNIAKGASDSELKFYIDVPESLEDIALDKTLFRIVISNLMTNAVKYNKPDGEVTLRMEEIDNSIKISVTDTGVGISDEDKDRVFEKYYRSSAEDVRLKSGHGLGLALARDIVQLHNGSISVNSEVGIGTEFIVEIYKDSELLLKIG